MTSDRPPIFPRHRKTLVWSLIGLLIPSLLGIVCSPLIALWLPSPLRRHVYHEISFQLIANNELPDTRVPEDVIRAAIDYTRRKIWLVDNPRPYVGKPFDYLVEGIGWCDYAAKVFCKLLAVKGIHARYAFLKDGNGVSPHTVAEVYLHGRWRVVDPFFNVTYPTDTGEWASLEEMTPATVEALPQMAQLRRTASDLDDELLSLARRTLPVLEPPQRSDDFITDRHIFDWVADTYVNLFGSRFANWYQDMFLRRQLATVPDPIDRLWYQARHHHLYGRFDQAEQRYRQLLVLHPLKYRERITLFLARMLLWQHRYLEACQVLATFLQESPDTRWAHFQIALCYEELHDPAHAIEHLQQYLDLHGSKYAVEAMTHLAQLHVAHPAMPRRGLRSLLQAMFRGDGKPYASSSTR